ncbi:hypothetical protein RB653_006331 [Dictyostelium firmibasis]|uniref:Cytochrome P450 n=1 Tax=Dictyostelium firmibasis TaxID=79012 RepID=A0AAN7UEB1_9MYCE
MNLSIIILIILIFFFFLKKNNNRIRSINSKIPGPIGLPIIGNLLQLKTEPHQVLFQWYEKYGPIFSIRMGSIDTVILSGYPIIKRALKDNPRIFTNRYEYWSKIQMNNASNLMMSNGNQHSILRKTVHSELTTIRVKKLESYIVREVEKLCKILDQHCQDGTSFSMNPYGNIFSLNIVVRFLFGLDIEYNDEKMKEFSKIVSSLFDSAGTPIISDFIPLARPFENFKGDRFKIVYNNISSYIESFVNEYKLKKQNGLIDEENDSTIVGKLLKEFENGSISWDNLIGTLSDICAGGGDTVADSITFALIALTNNSSCQEKLYNEIKKSLIKNNDDCDNENKDVFVIKHSIYRSLIPYLSMVIKETYRLFPVALLTLPNVTDQDFEIDGYKIAKGTKIIKNILVSHRSKDFFPSPNSFIPERFIETGNNFMFGCGDTNSLQFGIGTRDCIGKSLADCEMFTAIATLINRYEFINPTPSKPYDELGTPCLSLQPCHANFIIKKRK